MQKPPMNLTREASPENMGTLVSRGFDAFVAKKDSKQCCDAIMPESIHIKDESKRGYAFAFIFGVN